MRGKYIESVSPTPVASRLRAWHLPSQCAVCHGWGNARVCEACTLRFAARVPRCEGCALRVQGAVTLCGQCLRSPPSFDSALTGVDYDHPWDRLIARFKFNAALDLAASLAGLLVRAHIDSGRAQPALLLPVPLSDQRLRERGYNQAWEVTRRVAGTLRCPADPHLLLRLKDTPHQLALPRARRTANVRGAFAVEPRRAHELRGRSVTLVDDVMTTAATAAEISTVLKQAGAAEVHLWVVARTPAPGD